MTIASTINENNYIGSDSTDTFTYAYKIFAETDLLVTQADASDIETTLVLNTDYTVTGVGETAGGTIVLTAGNLTTGFALSIKRVRPITQLTDLRNLGDSFPETLEDTFDSIIMIAQFLDNNIGRSISIPETTLNFDTVLTEPEALKWSRVNAAGTGYEWVDAGNFSTLMTTVNGSLTLNAGELSVTNPVRFGVAGGTVDVITLAVTPAPASLTNNLRVYFEASGANTTPTPSLNVDGLGAKTIVKGSGSALLVGDISGANVRVDVVYDVSLGKWILLNPDDANKAEIQAGSLVYVEAAGLVNVMTAAYTPTIQALTDGMVVRLKVNLANTTITPTLNVDALGAKTIKREDGVALVIGDLPINYKAIFQWSVSHTAWILLNPALAKQHTHTSNADGKVINHMVVQRPITEDGAVATGTTVMVQDDSIPQSSEGDEYITVAITPVASTNKLIIEGVLHLANSATNSAMMAALFKGAETDALKGFISAKDTVANGISQIEIYHEMVAGVTSEITFKVRAGAVAAGTTTFNGVSGGRLFGGVMGSYLKVTELRLS